MDEEKTSTGYDVKMIAMITILIILVAGLSGYVLTRDDNGEEKEPIKIGVIVSMSGPASHMVRVKNGIELAVDDVNEKGGVNGRKIQLIIEDSESNNTVAVEAFRRIEEEHHPLLYLATQSSVCMELAPLAAEYSVPLIGLVASAEDLGNQNDWTFRFYVSAREEVTPIHKIIRDLNIDDLGVLYQDDEYGRSVLEEMERDYRPGGGNISNASFSPTTTDLRAGITALNDTEAIFLVGFANKYVPASEQMAELNYSGYRLMASGAVSDGYITQTHSQGSYLAAPIIYKEGFPYIEEVEKEYEKEFESAFTHQAANGFDCISLLDGLLDGEELTRDNIRSQLVRGYTHPGIFGDIDVPVGSHDILFPLYLTKVENSELIYL